MRNKASRTRADIHEYTGSAPEGSRGNTRRLAALREAADALTPESMADCFVLILFGILAHTKKAASASEWLAEAAMSWFSGNLLGRRRLDFGRCQILPSRPRTDPRGATREVSLRRTLGTTPRGERVGCRAGHLGLATAGDRLGGRHRRIHSDDGERGDRGNDEGMGVSHKGRIRHFKHPGCTNSGNPSIFPEFGMRGPPPGAGTAALPPSVRFARR